MKILQLAPVWETVPPPAYGGTEAVISVLTEELVRRGHQVRLCASGDSQTSAELFSVIPRSLRPQGLSDNSLQYSLVHVARSLQDADDFDVIHNHNGPPSDVAMAMSHLALPPVLTTLHNLPNEQSAFVWNAYKGWYNSISWRQADILPALPKAKFAGVVHNAVDVASFPFQAHKSDYLLFMGRMCQDKAPHLAIEAACRTGARILLAGKICLPEEHEYFETVIAPLLEPGRVEYVGEASSELKRELFAGARALLLPLLWEEPFGLVMIEAMACGTPVIAFGRGAAPEIVTHGDTGFLVEDVDEMVAALGLIDTIEPARCRSYVETCFSPSAMADRYLSLYNSILGIEEPQLDHVIAR